MMPAFRTNLEVVFQRFAPDDLAAMLALKPQTLGADAPLAFFGLECRFVAGEPCHSAFQCYIIVGGISTRVRQAWAGAMNASHWYQEGQYQYHRPLGAL